MSPRGWRCVAGLGVAVAIAVFGAAARPLAHRAVFPGAAAALPDGPSLAGLWPGAARIEVRAADGMALAAAWLPARGRSRGRAVYFHATNQSAGDSLWFARELAARGLDTCLPEHRGYGGLGGEPSVAAILDDAEAALAACPDGGAPLVVAGRSLGAAVAAEMARRGHGDALVLASPFTSLDQVAGPLGWALPPADRFDLLAAVRGGRVPVTVVHGTADALVPFGMGMEVARLSGGRLVPLAGAGHNDLFLGEARARLIDAIVEAVPARREGGDAS